jgi:hypothetical protein
VKNQKIKRGTSSVVRVFVEGSINICFRDLKEVYMFFSTRIFSKVAVFTRGNFCSLRIIIIEELSFSFSFFLSIVL